MANKTSYKPNSEVFVNTSSIKKEKLSQPKLTAVESLGVFVLGNGYDRQVKRVLVGKDDRSPNYVKLVFLFRGGKPTNATLRVPAKEWAIISSMLGATQDASSKE